MFSNRKGNNMKIITCETKIKAAIKSIQARGQRLDRDIWVAAVSTMAHHNKHGDTTLINGLVDAMPKGSRVNALREFITAFGKVTFNEETKAFDHDKAGNFDLDGATATSWVDFKPEPEYKPIDALALVKAMVTKINNVDPEKGDKCTQKQAKAINALAVELGVEV